MDTIVGHGLANIKRIQGRMKDVAADLEAGTATPRIATVRHLAWWTLGMILSLTLAIPLALTRDEDNE